MIKTDGAIRDWEVTKRTRAAGHFIANETKNNGVGAQSLAKQSQFSDVKCAEHRHGVRPRSRCASPCIHGSLPCPAAERARRNPRPPESSEPKKNEDHILHVHTPGIKTSKYVNDEKYATVARATVQRRGGKGISTSRLSPMAINVSVHNLLPRPKVMNALY